MLWLSTAMTSATQGRGGDDQQAGTSPENLGIAANMPLLPRVAMSAT